MSASWSSDPKRHFLKSYKSFIIKQAKLAHNVSSRGKLEVRLNLTSKKHRTRAVPDKYYRTRFLKALKHQEILTGIPHSTIVRSFC